MSLPMFFVNCAKIIIFLREKIDHRMVYDLWTWAQGAKHVKSFTQLYE